MRNASSLFAIACGCVLFGGLESAIAQGRGGGRGRSEEIQKRSGSYFVDASFPAASDAAVKKPLEACAHVKSAAGKGHLSLLYLFDPHANKTKHPMFETVVFGNQPVSVALKWFRCGRIDLSKETDGAKFGKRAPMFVAFNAKGKQVGEVSMRGYKAVPGSLVKLLTRAAKGYSKLPMGRFVKDYRKFLTNLQLLEGKKRTLQNKQQRLGNRPKASKLAKLEKEKAALAKSEKTLLEGEKKLLEKAKVPPRDPKAQRLGDRRRGRR